MIRQIAAFARRLFGPRVQLTPRVAPATCVPEVPDRLRLKERPAPKITPKRGRPLSATLTRTIEMLAANPGVTPAEVARELSVVPSYARTLLRRARERADEITAAAPVPASATSVRGMEMEAVLCRLEAAESEIRQLRSCRPSAPSGPRWDLCGRAEVIQRGLAGEDPAQIASSLRVPLGEVRFLLKVHRLLMKTG